MTDIADRAVEALLDLAAIQDFDRIELADIAGRAGLTLAELRSAFDGKYDILAAFTRQIDGKVLAETADDMDDEPARERLFDVAMRRFDHLKPYREALLSVRRGLRRDPLALPTLNRQALASATWMLAAAKIDSSGFAGRLRAQGLVCAMARTLDVFLRDDDAGLARTMAELDRRLRDGENAMDFLARLPFGGRRRPRRSEAPEQGAAA